MKLSKEDLLINFGNHLSDIRKKKNLTLRELADRCSVDFSEIGKIETGKRNVSLVNLVELANGLSIHPKKLLEFEIDKPIQPKKTQGK
jgi:transcriptional regulator with XRE-family HTH domain